MNSPFPGMDPYIEHCGLWIDFHDDLIAEIKRSLAARLPKTGISPIPIDDAIPSE
jgi:hypothetical protein